jgi:hypothetical protein
VTNESVLPLFKNPSLFLAQFLLVRNGSFPLIAASPIHHVVQYSIVTIFPAAAVSYRQSIRFILISPKILAYVFEYARQLIIQLTRNN